MVFWESLPAFSGADGTSGTGYDNDPGTRDEPLVNCACTGRLGILPPVTIPDREITEGDASAPPSGAEGPPSPVGGQQGRTPTVFAWAENGR